MIPSSGWRRNSSPAVGRAGGGGRVSGIPDLRRGLLRHPALHCWWMAAWPSIQAGLEDSESTGAQIYQLWYRLQPSDDGNGWAQAVVTSGFETGADGRPSSVVFNFFPAVAAREPGGWKRRCWLERC